MTEGGEHGGGIGDRRKCARRVQNSSLPKGGSSPDGDPLKKPLMGTSCTRRPRPPPHVARFGHRDASDGQVIAGNIRAQVHFPWERWRITINSDMCAKQSSTTTFPESGECVRQQDNRWSQTKQATDEIRNYQPILRVLEDFSNDTSSDCKQCQCSIFRDVGAGSSPVFPPSRRVKLYHDRISTRHKTTDKRSTYRVPTSAATS